MSRMNKWLVSSIAVALLLVVSFLALARYLGAWHLLFPSRHHHSVAPVLSPSLQSGAVLIFTKTNAFRHVDAIDSGTALFSSIAEQRNWPSFHTENGAIFNTRDLQKFSVVIFHNTTGDTLSTEQKAAFRQWLESGGSWLGVHAAGDSSHGHWPWYQKTLIGVQFTAHTMGPQFQTATVINEKADHQVMKALPATWQHNEEWYSWQQSPRKKGFQILASVDEHSYSPHTKFFGLEKDLRMVDHPIVWFRSVGQGLALYSALGHSGESYSNPQHRQLLENTLIWLKQHSDVTAKAVDLPRQTPVELHQ